MTPTNFIIEMTDIQLNKKFYVESFETMDNEPNPYTTSNIEDAARFEYSTATILAKMMNTIYAGKQTFQVIYNA